MSQIWGGLCPKLGTQSVPNAGKIVPEICDKMRSAGGYLVPHFKENGGPLLGHFGTPWSLLGTPAVPDLGQQLSQTRDSRCPRFGANFVPDLGQSLPQIWDKVCPRFGTKFAPDPGQSLSQIWDKICPRSGTKFAPESGQSLSQIWNKPCPRVGKTSAPDPGQNWTAMCVNV